MPGKRFKTKPKYKDRFFCLIFGMEKKNIISLYIGKSDAPATSELRLSDAFVKDSPKGQFEWTATFVNLNKGKNEELLDKCKPLAEYMFLINCIRENEAKGMEIEHAIDSAVQRMDLVQLVSTDEKAREKYYKIYDIK